MYSDKTVFELLHQMDEREITILDEDDSELSLIEILRNYSPFVRRPNRRRLSTVPVYVPLEKAA